MNRINVTKRNCIIMFLWLMMSCSEEERWQYATDSIPPGQVSDVHVENLPGGAIITYMVPDDDDLWYVKVVYRMSDGTQVEQKSSASLPRIAVEGLGRAQKQTVQLICGDYSGNESAPYFQEIDPLDAPIYEIQESIAMVEDFGGIKITWENPLKASIVLTLYVLDEYGSFVEIQNIYSNSNTGRYNLRGFPSEERTFSVTVRDRWHNKTERVSGDFIPLFEEKLDRLKFGRWNPPGIPYADLTSGGVVWSIERLWDGLLANPGFSFPSTNVLPNSITFNMGQMAKLSRMKAYQRTTDGQTFNGYSVKRFKLYASSTPDVNEDFDTWLYMGEWISEKPSGLPLGQLTDEDRAYAEAGEDLIIEENVETYVQYIRVHIMETWGGGMSVAQFFEMEFFGSIMK